MYATAKDLRFNVKHLLDVVQRGEVVTITYRGQPCAMLSPIQEIIENNGEKAVFGMWQDRIDLNVDAPKLPTNG